MHHHVLDFGIVHGALGVPAPNVLGSGVVGVNPNQVHFVEIDEFEAARILHAAAHDQMQLVHGAAL